MAHDSTVYLVPLILAFLVLIVTYYIRDNVRSPLRPSFLLAVVSFVLLLGYLGLSVVDSLPYYAGPVVGGIGVVLLVVGIILFRD